MYIDQVGLPLPSKVYHYQAYGLSIDSEIELPDFIERAERKPGEPDVSIRFGRIPLNLKSPRKVGLRYQAAPEEFLLRVDNQAGYLVQSGRHITMDCEKGSEEGAIRLFLQGSALCALLHQRRLLVLHASAILHQEQAILFVGQSGAGKSTTAAAFHRRGYKLISDDLGVIASEENSLPKLLPAYPQLKLWHDALLQLDEKPTDYCQLYSEIEKRRKPIQPSEFHNQPVPIGRIYLLAPSHNHNVQLTPLQGAEKVAVLKQHTQRKHLIEGLNIALPHFRQVAELAAAAPLIRVARPQSHYSLNELVDVLEEDFRE